jgi:hypothetical protein
LVVVVLGTASFFIHLNVDKAPLKPSLLKSRPPSANQHTRHFVDIGPAPLSPSGIDGLADSSG